MGVEEAGDELGPLCEGLPPCQRLRDSNEFFVVADN